MSDLHLGASAVLREEAAVALAWLAARGVVALPVVAVAAQSRSTSHATLPVMASEAVEMACGEGALTFCRKSPALQSYCSGMANPDSEADTVALFASLLVRSRGCSPSRR